MKTLIIGLLAGGAVLASAGIANATPQEDAVIQQLADAGYHSTPGMTQRAHKVCNRLARGPSPGPDHAATSGDDRARQGQHVLRRLGRNLCP